MAHHTIMDPKYLDPKEKRDKKLTELGLFSNNILKRELDKKKYEQLVRGQRIAQNSKKLPEWKNNQPTQLGNLNEDNTLAFIMSGGPVIKQGFNLSKKAPSIIKKFLKKGKNLAVNFADDAVNVISSLGQSK